MITAVSPSPAWIVGRSIQTPTIFNVGLNFRLNWRGNFRTLEDQNEAVLLDPRLMGTTWDEMLPSCVPTRTTVRPSRQTTWRTRPRACPRRPRHVRSGPS